MAWLKAAAHRAAPTRASEYRRASQMMLTQVQDARGCTDACEQHMQGNEPADEWERRARAELLGEWAWSSVERGHGFGSRAVSRVGMGAGHSHARGGCSLWRKAMHVAPETRGRRHGRSRKWADGACTRLLSACVASRVRADVGYGLKSGAGGVGTRGFDAHNWVVGGTPSWPRWGTHTAVGWCTRWGSLADKWDVKDAKRPGRRQQLVGRRQHRWRGKAEGVSHEFDAATAMLKPATGSSGEDRTDSKHPAVKMVLTNFRRNLARIGGPIDTDIKRGRAARAHCRVAEAPHTLALQSCRLRIVYGRTSGTQSELVKSVGQVADSSAFDASFEGMSLRIARDSQGACPCTLWLSRGLSAVRVPSRLLWTLFSVHSLIWPDCDGCRKSVARRSSAFSVIKCAATAMLCLHVLWPRKTSHRNTAAQSGAMQKQA
ncbi:hypothetical protein GGX14DRAFT_397291 [Mycena pura]|uniref:Uncharacterized protein n=1 Tax=Mycena pura TaxID=153505 RepID=A0AAD6VCH9_9AGAR|nr:hypothetical protein GGX14DRAFT_397291 [Mycena pura]